MKDTEQAFVDKEEKIEDKLAENDSVNYELTELDGKIQAKD